MQGFIDKLQNQAMDFITSNLINLGYLIAGAVLLGMAIGSIKVMIGKLFNWLLEIGDKAATKLGEKPKALALLGLIAAGACFIYGRGNQTKQTVAAAQTMPAPLPEVATSNEFKVTVAAGMPEWFTEILELSSQIDKEHKKQMMLDGQKANNSQKYRFENHRGIGVWMYHEKCSICDKNCRLEARGEALLARHPGSTWDCP